MTTTEQPPTTPDAGHRHARESHLRHIRIGDMIPAPRAQRDFRPTWASQLASKFNLEGMGYIVVSYRGGTYFVIDGQHRLAALKLLGFPDSDVVECEVYENLTEEQEAEIFLQRSYSKTVAALDLFRVGVNAGRQEEVQIDACVRNQGLRIGKDRTRHGTTPVVITAVTTLRTVYRNCGVLGLGKTLRIIRDAYGGDGFEAALISGIGLLVQRYEDGLDEDVTIKALAATVGGLNGLLQQANRTRAQMGQSRAHCVAATTVELYNRTAPRNKKLPSWWQQ